MVLNLYIREPIAKTWDNDVYTLGNPDFFISKFHVPNALFCNINAVLQIV